MEKNTKKITDREIQKGIVLKMSKEIRIYKFYDRGQHIFLIYTVPANTYQQDISQKNIFFGPV